MPHRNPIAPALAFALLAFTPGCEPEAKSKRMSAPTRETVGKKTQEVRDLKVELTRGGVVSDGKIHAQDPITINADAYRTSVGNISKMSVQHSIDLYEAGNGEKPKTYQEFMDVIIKKGQPDGLWLPMLPYYQEYGYDADKKELVVIDYPEKKKAVDAQWDKELGRK